MRYDLNQLSDPFRFQRLVNAILVARFGEDVRLTPLYGKDGGSDGETAADNPNMLFDLQVAPSRPENPVIEPPRPGRYLFQTKYHRTGEQPVRDIRSRVVGEFGQSLRDHVLARKDRKDVNYFFLVTNVSASLDSLKRIDKIRLELLQEHPHLHADIWWAERITTFLDWSPRLWSAFPELFPGRAPPILGIATTQSSNGLPRILRLAVSQQYRKDSQVKFRQIELAKRLLDLFVDLDISVLPSDSETPGPQAPSRFVRRAPSDSSTFYGEGYRHYRHPDSALQILLDDELAIPKILLEGGPGQGKSTITQMAAQVYREKFLDARETESRDPAWHSLCRLRIPIRLELRDLAHWIAKNENGSLEQFIALGISNDSGGHEISVKDVQNLFSNSSVILLFDGLDEIGNDVLRDRVLDVAMEAISRFEKVLRTDIRVVLTTRPPAVLGRWNKLEGFTRVILAPMESERIDEYVQRWLHVQISDDDERIRIKTSFNSRRQDSHVEALARNPMQLSVLLQFIYLKGEAFPDRRAELYRDYFQIVIDRDVEKSRELREHRELVEGLHSYLGFHLHGAAEVEQGRRALNRTEIIELAGQWLREEGPSEELAAKYFALGEERFGLIVALSGEGQETAYGFEVQPIQEYFAAAYVSNRLADGKAHDVFQSLISRDYWREVALFLAGLRRPNEKADLIARARVADDDLTTHWQQNGRAIILQLLREGVLSQPRHVKTEAMRFAMGFLDPRDLRYHRAPNSLVHALAEMARTYASDATNKKIVRIVDQFSNSDDLGLVSLLHQLAGSVLPQKEYIRLVREYSGESPETRGLVRVTGPFNVPGTIEELGSNQAFWEGIPARELARRLWVAAIRDSRVPEISYPSRTHSNLIIQFAIRQLGVRRYERRAIEVQSTSAPAIWKLLQNIQLVSSWPLYENGQSSRIGEHFARSQAFELMWLDGTAYSLPLDVKECVEDLISATQEMIAALHKQNRKVIDKAFLASAKAMRKQIDRPGIVGWIACRCATELLRSPALSTLDQKHKREADDLLNSVRELYSLPDRYLPRTAHVLDRMTLGMPRALRMEHGAVVRPLHEVIADLVTKRVLPSQARYCSWLKDVALPAWLIRPLVEECRNEMQQLLRFIGSNWVSSTISYTTNHRIKVQDTRKILKICRETQDPQVLQGAATVLMNATFARVAKPELIQKILTAAPASALVSRVFGSSDNTRELARDAAFKQLALDVAQRISEKPDEQPFLVINRAAAFLAEAQATRSVPLFKEFPEFLQST